MDPAQTPRQAIATFETQHDLRLTVHDLAGSLWPFLSPLRTLHDQPLCRAVKLEPGGWRCVDFDIRQVRDATAARPCGFVKVCHAGLLEWVVPVQAGGTPQWVLMAGVRRPGRGLRDALTHRPSSTLPRRWTRQAGALPAVDADQAEHVLEALRQLAARLKLWVMEEAPALAGRSTGAAAPPPRTRAAVIRRFIDEHHTAPIRLADLARALGLSPDRTAHLVPELCDGASFLDLLHAARLRTAAALLIHSDLTLDQVAARSGFGDVSHFHRLFRRHHGQTPARYRRTPPAPTRTPAPDHASSPRRPT